MFDVDTSHKLALNSKQIFNRINFLPSAFARECYLTALAAAMLSFIDRFDVLECSIERNICAGWFRVKRELEIDPNFKQIMPDHAT